MFTLLFRKEHLINVFSSQCEVCCVPWSYLWHQVAWRLLDRPDGNGSPRGEWQVLQCWWCSILLLDFLLSLTNKQERSLFCHTKSTWTDKSNTCSENFKNINSYCFSCSGFLFQSYWFHVNIINHRTIYTVTIHLLYYNQQEVDFAPGAFILDYERHKAADSMWIYGSSQIRILSGLRGLKQNPWGFVLPVTPLVWAATLTALLGVLAVLQLFPSCLPGRTIGQGGWSAYNPFTCVRVILQQGKTSRALFDSTWLYHVRLAPMGVVSSTSISVKRNYHKYFLEEF